MALVQLFIITKTKERVNIPHGIAFDAPSVDHKVLVLLYLYILFDAHDENNIMLL